MCFHNSCTSRIELPCRPGGSRSRRGCSSSRRVAILRTPSMAWRQTTSPVVVLLLLPPMLASIVCVVSLCRYSCASPYAIDPPTWSRPKPSVRFLPRSRLSLFRLPLPRFHLRRCVRIQDCHAHRLSAGCRHVGRIEPVVVVVPLVPKRLCTLAFLELCDEFFRYDVLGVAGVFLISFRRPQ